MVGTDKIYLCINGGEEKVKKAESRDTDYRICYLKHEIKEQEERKNRAGYQKAEIAKNVFAFIPKAFIRSPEDYCNSKYLYEYRPKIVYSEMAANCDLLFQETENIPSDLLQAREIAAEAVKNCNKEAIFYGKGFIEAEKITAGWFEYKDFAESEPVYNMAFLADPGEKRIFGVFNCLFGSYDKWKPVFLDIIKSIRMEEVTADEGILD